MAAPQVNLIREDDREMFFAHRPLAGIVFMLIGGAVIYFFSTSPLVNEQLARWIFAAAGVLFVLAGFGAALWRCELRLDLAARTYRRRKGFWPAPKDLRGSLDELEAVTLSSRMERSDKNTYTVWSVSLKFRTWEEQARIMESRNDVAACRTLEHYAKKLRVPVIDGSGTQVRATQWTDVDRPLKDQPGRPAVIPSLPPESRIEFTNEPGGRMIKLPSSGLSFAGVFLMLFGTPFFCGGMFFLWMLLFGPPGQVHGPLCLDWILSTVFMLAGAFIIFLGAAGMWGRPFLEEDGSRINYSMTLFGTRMWPQRLLKHEVEEVSIKTAPDNRADRQELVIRSNAKIIHVNGEGLSGRELDWIRIAISVIAAA